MQWTEQRDCSYILEHFLIHDSGTLFVTNANSSQFAKSKLSIKDILVAMNCSRLFIKEVEAYTSNVILHKHISKEQTNNSLSKLKCFIIINFIFMTF